MDIHKLLINKMVKVRSLEDIESEMPDRTKLSDIIPIYGLGKVIERITTREILREDRYNYLSEYTFEDRNSVRSNIICENFKDDIYDFGIYVLNIIYGLGIYQLAKEMFN